MKDESWRDNGNGLRRGYTTGSCAAAAAKAATLLLLRAQAPEAVAIQLPEHTGERAGQYPRQLMLEVEVFPSPEGEAVCGVYKDSGDDPDVTHGALICARVSRREDGEIAVVGGEGVGRVTRPGLSCPVGSAAINPVPERMIRENVREACRECGYPGGMTVTILVPQGRALAKKTYNPRLGIVDGVSILGTSGIVEPMSEAALIATIRAEMDVQAASGEKTLVLTPGNYGEEYLRTVLGIGERRLVRCSNFIGEALDYAVKLPFERVLLVGHAGKLVKVAGGIMNTHSRYADARMELITAQAALCGAPREFLEKVMGCITTDEAAGLLLEEGLVKDVFSALMERAAMRLSQRMGGEKPAACLTFSLRYGLLGYSSGAPELIRLLGGQLPDTPVSGRREEEGGENACDS